MFKKRAVLLANFNILKDFHVLEEELPNVTGKTRRVGCSSVAEM